MAIKKVVLNNFKIYNDIEIDFNSTLNIIIGNNEAGKTTLLEAINLALTGQINGRNINNELTPYLFNTSVVKKYVEDVANNNNVIPPKILIEVYLDEDGENEQIAELSGTNNSKKENCPGISLSIEFDDSFSEEYIKYITSKEKITTIPIEYYKVNWYSFAYKTITTRSVPVNVTLLDTSSNKNFYGTDKYIFKIIDDILDVQKKVDLSLVYRNMKESFANNETVKEINSELSHKSDSITDKKLTVSVDVSAKNSWENTLTSYLDDIPFNYVGKGEESTVKMKLALETTASQSNIILIEEPENHLSFSNMNILIDRISSKCAGKQLFITTHSNFVLNKLGIENVILIANNMTVHFKDLPVSTQTYFRKLPGYDTLRIILSQKSILVEGPSDELIVQKAYLQEYKKLPIEDGIDVISVRGLSFKRFLDIAKILKNNVCVVTDNDGDYLKLEKKYLDYKDNDNIKISYSKNNSLVTLENHILDLNGLELINEIVDKNFDNNDDALNYMVNNKTEWALAAFEFKNKLEIPRYIKDAIE